MLCRGFSNRPLIAVVIVAVMTWVAACTMVTRAEAASTNSGVSIHRYAAFDDQAISGVAKRIAATAANKSHRRALVSIYGRSFALNLENNAQVIAPSLEPGSGTAVLRGTVEGMPNSWVRLTRVASGTHGLIWNGNELYAIEPSAEIKDVLGRSLPAPNTATVIFKLSDTTVDLGGDYCGSSGNANVATTNTGLATYQALSADLTQQSATPDSGPTLRLEMQVLADAAFRAEYESDQAALEAIMVRLNNVDGIYSAQLGLEVQATDIRLFAQDPATLSNSTSAETLLQSLGYMRASAPGMNSYAATHLFTGRDLDGDTLGIAYIGKICGARYGASLSEIRNRGSWIDSLVAAHELGHQLGAVHDGTGVCDSTATEGYLMSAFINGSEELSQCSRDTMLTTMQYAACLVPIGAPDIGVAIGSATLNAIPDTSFKWTVTIQNAGTGIATHASAHIDVPAELLVETGVVDGGSCTISNGSQGGILDCELGALAVNEIRQAEVTLRSAQQGQYLITATVATDRDENLANNQTQVSVTISNDVASASVSNNTASASTPASAQGGGGGFDFGWLLVLSTLAGQPLRRSRRHAA